MADNKARNLSSWLVHPAALAVWFVLFIISFISQMHLLTAFFLGVFFITLSSKIWSRSILSKIIAEVDAFTSRLFPGEEVELHYTFKNKKFWPLIWLHWVQGFPEGHILVPADREDWLCEKVEEDKEAYFYSRRLGWIMWYHSIEWKSMWRAQRRGIYNLSSVSLSSGDGFGLSAVMKGYNLDKPLKLIVYPALVPVALEGLLHQHWGSKTGAYGLIEDHTLIRGIRNFQPGDSWKSINWRMAALQKPLQVNIYETLKYEAFCFVVDIRSFLESPKEEDFEDALSILASLMVALHEKNIPVGLAVPSSGSYPAAFFPPRADETYLMEMMDALAGLCLEKSGSIQKSLTGLGVDDSDTQFFLVTYRHWDISKIASNLDIQKNKVWTILAYEGALEASPKALFEGSHPVIDMKSLKKK